MKHGTGIAFLGLAVTLGSSFPLTAQSRSMLDEAPKVLPGFEARLVYRVPPEQGSWVSLTVDSKGRFITSDQDGGLFRMTLQERQPPLVEALSVPIGSAQGLLCAHDSLYVVANHWLSHEDREAGRGPGYETGLYRVRDTDGDDQYDAVNLLRRFEGAGEHGPHAVVLGPDGESLYVLGGNGCSLPSPERSRVPRRWQMDNLLPRLGQTDGFWTPTRPGGWICRTDAEGGEFELMAVGFRNPYDFAFNADGELFTFDADMEWDMGVSWYRPTRVNHVTSGAEFGWRTGSVKWPDDWFDSLPAVVDVGASSPTGLTFGYGAKFPARWQRALFLGDWSFGKIYALHLTADGATYRGEFETFLSGAPLPITDLVVHPGDGALYFITGGRDTASGLYRVRYVGDEPTAPAKLVDDQGAEARARRRDLETFHGRVDPKAVNAVWPFLNSADRYLRHAARVALEHQPVATWADRAFAESAPRTAIAALTALARCSDEMAHFPRIIGRLTAMDWKELPDPDRGDLLRAFQLAFIRSDGCIPAARERAVECLNPLFPAATWPLNRDLAQLLVYLEAPGAIDRTLDLLTKAASQEEQTHYILTLRTIERERWTLPQLRVVLAWFRDATARRGGVTFSDYVSLMRSEYLEKLSDADREALADVLAREDDAGPLASLQQREFVQQWKVADLAEAVEGIRSGRDFESGRRAYTEAMCINCHRFNGAGGMTGPDLTAVGRRFDARMLLESMLEPSKVISDQYSTVQVEMTDGDLHTGRIANIDEEDVYLMVDLLNPAAILKLSHGDIDSIEPSTVSMMPTNLLDYFSRAEILDLIAWLQWQGDPESPVFQKSSTR
jgi:putative heme-binding domain-containing protein